MCIGRSVRCSNENESEFNETKRETRCHWNLAFENSGRPFDSRPTNKASDQNSTNPKIDEKIPDRFEWSEFDWIWSTIESRVHAKERKVVVNAYRIIDLLSRQNVAALPELREIISRGDLTLSEGEIFEWRRNESSVRQNREDLVLCWCCVLWAWVLDNK